MMIFAFGQDSHLSDESALRCNSESYEKIGTVLDSETEEVFFFIVL